MIITVHLHTTLQRQSPEGPVRRLEIELPGGSRIRDLLDMLGVDMPIEAMLLAVNYQVAEAEQVLQDGDQVNIMPAISGGHI